MGQKYLRVLEDYLRKRANSIFEKLSRRTSISPWYGERVESRAANRVATRTTGSKTKMDAATRSLKVEEGCSVLSSQGALNICRPAAPAPLSGGI